MCTVNFYSKCFKLGSKSKQLENDFQSAFNFRPFNAQILKCVGVECVSISTHLTHKIAIQDS